MELSELTAYAGEKYRIWEQHNWADLPGLSVLCHPQTGKWLAVLMRQWDPETGTQLECCDLKCGRECLSRFHAAYLSLPVRMFGSKWINISFNADTDSSVVLKLFDQAVASDPPYGFTVVLPSQSPAPESVYRETALPFAGSAYRPVAEPIPDRLREMRRLYTYGSLSEDMRTKNFYRQAVFMQDYEDDVPWSGDFVCYFPTYHDLSIRQLRGYFTWRAQVRKGIFEPIAASCAYIYIYELLNGVGAASPEEVLQKLLAFKTGYAEAAADDKRMRQNLQRWMLEYAVLHDIAPETARQYADPELLERDRAVTVLKTPAAYSDGEVFSALLTWGGKKAAGSPVLLRDPERGKHLFSEAWRAAVSYREDGKTLFSLCFGKKPVRRWYPLSNAVYCEQKKQKDRVYSLDDSRRFTYKNGVWHVSAYEKLSLNKSRFMSFIHGTDTVLRRYLETGRYLKEDPEDEWIFLIMDTVLAADRKAQREAAKPKITIDLGGLEQIRRDAEITRDSLLTEEEMAEPDETEEPDAAVSAQALPEIPLNEVQIRIIRALLRGEDAVKVITDAHMMPSIAADFINEALFDDIGDNVLLFEDGKLSLVEDYITDLEQMLGGSANG